MDNKNGEPSTELTANGALAVHGARTEFLSKAQQQKKLRLAKAERTFGRGHKIDVKTIKDKKLKRNLKQLEDKIENANVSALDAELLHEHTPGYLEPEGELERTYKVRQDDIQKEVAVETAQKRFELKLDQLGPYICDFTRNGRELLLAGRKGHVSAMDWREGKMFCELQLRETVRDAVWLHSNQFFALAQRQNVFIYSRDGVELHCLKKHNEVSHMQFLPYHFLLATLNLGGHLKYQDVSTGQIVSEINTKSGQPVSLAQNPWNAVLHAGHQNGTVTLWSPSSSEPLVKLLAHKGPVRSLAVDRGGNYMVTTSQDMKMSVFDIRMFKEVNQYFTRTPASTVAISDTGVVAVGGSTKVTMWKGLFTKHVAEHEKVQSPYMSWPGEGRQIEKVKWCPFEDILGVGHSKGYSSLIVPGAGEANFDVLEANPFETVKQRQEGEVKALLNKLKPEMIALNPDFIGNLDLRSDQQRRAEKDLDAPPADIAEEVRNKMRGKNTALKKYIRKQRKRNVIDEKKLRVEEMWKEHQKKRDKQYKEQKDELGPALGRFARKT